MEALDLTDQNSRQEYNAYERLAKEYRQIAAQLHATANQTAGYWDLRWEFLSLLEETAEHDDKLLEAMSIHNR